MAGQFFGHLGRQLELELDFGAHDFLVPRDSRSGRAVEAQIGQGGEFLGGLHTFGDHRQADIMRDAA